MNHYPAHARSRFVGIGQVPYPPYPSGMQGAVPAAPPAVQSFVFTPGSLPQGISGTPGSQVVLGLPQGSTWQDVSVDLLGTIAPGPTPLATQGSSVPVTLTVPPGPATVSAAWIDTSGARQAGAAIFLPAGATLSTPITDSAAVTAVQNMLNKIIASGPPSGLVLQSVAANGNASDPAFMAQLAALQQFAVNQFANPSAAGMSIAPAALNVPTNGVLDYATLALLSMPL